MGTFYGGGDPYFQNDALVTADDENVAAGNGSANALSLVLDPLNIGANYTFFGTFIQCAEGSLGTNTGLDISSADTISFDLRLGAAGAWDQYAVKLEDVAPTGAGDFQNTFQLLSPNPVDTAWTTYTFPLSDFTGGSQPVDPSIFNQITIEGNPGPSGGGTTVFNLLVDNVEIVSNASSVGDWNLY